MRILIGGAARCGFMVWLAVAMTGCTAGIATQVGEPIRPAGGAEVEIETLALLPPTTERGSEDAGPVVMAAAETFLERTFPGLPLVVAEEARNRLGSRGVGADLAQLLRDYDDSGVADLDRIHRVLEALEVDHVLQLRVGLTEGDVLRGGIFAEDVSDERRREVVIVALLLGPPGVALPGLRLGGTRVQASRGRLHRARRSRPRRQGFTGNPAGDVTAVTGSRYLHRPAVHLLPASGG